MIRYVIVHEKDGVFLGHAMGLAFFSLLDCGGQYTATTFESEEDARDYISEAGLDLSAFTIYRVHTNERWADFIELLNAGVPQAMIQPMADVGAKIYELQRAAGRKPH